MAALRPFSYEGRLGTGCEPRLKLIKNATSRAGLVLGEHVFKKEADIGTFGRGPCGSFEGLQITSATGLLMLVYTAEQGSASHDKLQLLAN